MKPCIIMMNVTNQEKLAHFIASIAVFVMGVWMVSISPVKPVPFIAGLMFFSFSIVIFIRQLDVKRKTKNAINNIFGILAIIFGLLGAIIGMFF